jgi:outer membrane receptor for ferrienterochelin and colicin
MREPQLLLHAAQSIDVFGREQLDGYVDVGDALNTVPGVYLPALSGNEQHNMGIREALPANATHAFGDHKPAAAGWPTSMALSTARRRLACYC